VALPEVAIFASQRVVVIFWVESFLIRKFINDFLKQRQIKTALFG
jgi:hypothetical protein